MDSKSGVRSFRDRRRPVISKGKQKPNLGASVAESAGQTAAGCAAVFCCCPCGLASLLYLTAVKLPARLVRQALGRVVSFAKKGAGIQPKKDVFDDDAISVHSGWIPVAMWAEDDVWPSKMASPELVALEKEMSAWFYGAGFWRSPERVKGSSPEKGENLTFVRGETEDDRLKSHFFDPIQTQIPIQLL